MSAYQMPQIVLSQKELSENKFTQEEIIKKTIEKFKKLFSIVINNEVKFISQDKVEGFLIGEKGFISIHNYDVVREIIMKQNLIFEQKIYKTELMNKWAQKALKAKQKNAPKISMEDIITTVSVGCSKNYSDLENYTIYQIYSDFYRLRKLMSYDTNVQFKCVGADLTLEDYAEDLDLFHNPYDDLFVSADKLGGLNKAIKNN
jgi:hypothetical protein